MNGIDFKKMPVRYYVTTMTKPADQVDPNLTRIKWLI